MDRILLAALLRIDLPGHSVRLVDGGSLPWGVDVYSSEDSLLGVPKGFVALREGVGARAPAGVLTFLTPDAAQVPSSTLMNPAWQFARIRTYIAEVDPDTGTVTGEPDQQSDWLIDQPVLRFPPGGRELDLVCISHWQRLFEIDRGNSLSPSFHKSLYAGETGLDNGSGVETNFPWAAAQAPRGLE